MTTAANHGNDTVDLFALGIAHWAAQVRQGELTFRSSMEICLSNIDKEKSLNAFECVDALSALAAASKMDARLSTGEDRGPFMGLPIGVKDIMAVDGFPTTCGSNADLDDLALKEGTVVSTLKEAGAIVVGKTKTVEFALGATGVNESRGTPWNPVDRVNHRMPGGSSSGSAVATSAGLLGLALGSDTGGSIRNPACMTGIVGYKSSVGIWPLDGIFELSPTLDSVGPLCRTVNDASLMHRLFSGETVAQLPGVAGLRLGIVKDLFHDNLDPEIAADFERVCALLEEHGAVRVPVSFPELHERNALFSSIVPAELIRYLSEERFLRVRDGVDTVTESRASVGLKTSAHTYLNAQKRRRELVDKARSTFDDVDVWISPTSPVYPQIVTDFSDPDVHDKGLLASQNTQSANLLEMCALSIPMHQSGLPSGFQIMMPLREDKKLLSIAEAIETLLNA